jgi:hypothetical protein
VMVSHPNIVTGWSEQGGCGHTNASRFVLGRRVAWARPAGNLAEAAVCPGVQTVQTGRSLEGGAEMETSTALEVASPISGGGRGGRRGAQQGTPPESTRDGVVAGNEPIDGCRRRARRSYNVPYSPPTPPEHRGWRRAAEDHGGPQQTIVGLQARISKHATPRRCAWFVNAKGAVASGRSVCLFSHFCGFGRKGLNEIHGASCLAPVRGRGKGVAFVWNCVCRNKVVCWTRLPLKRHRQTGPRCDLAGSLSRPLHPTGGGNARRLAG